MLRWHTRLAAARHATAGVEFAIIVPVLLVMLAGLSDLSFAILTARRLTAAAGDMAFIASTMAVQSSNPNTLTGRQAWQATTAPFALFPAWANPARGSGFAITLSAVDFKSEPANCRDGCNGFRASTRWSVANVSGQVALRPCGTLAMVPDGSPPALNTLPAGVFGQTSILVADVSAVFTPIFTSVFTGPVTLTRSAYVSPRESNGVTLLDTSAAKTVICPSTGN